MNKKKVIIITTIIVVVTNLFTLILSGVASKAMDFFSGAFVNVQGVPFSEIVKYNRIKDMIKEKYVENISDTDLMEGSIKGLAEATNDPYTTYMNKEEFASLEAYTKANYGGIGVVVGIDPADNLIVISEVIENSPALKAQIHAGDKIIKVNGTDVSGDDFEKAVSLIKGERGTTVKITVLRPEANKELDFDVVRDVIEIKTVKSNVLPNGEGYIRILQFSENTSGEFSSAINDLKSKGINKFVLDLRDNPGGLLEQVVEVCGQLMPKNLVVYTIDKQGKREDYNSNGNGTDMKFVVLVNERSASASEILAGAVKDYKRAQIVGTTTFGKGIVQSVFGLDDGSGIKITTSKYFTPNGVSIHKVGVKPDVEVEQNVKDKVISKLTYEEDNQLQRAIEELNK